MTQETQAPEVTLEITDIANATQIMKAAIERGVFQAEEMSGVAGVFDKFHAFMVQVQKAEEAAQAEAADVESDEAKGE